MSLTATVDPATVIASKTPGKSVLRIDVPEDIDKVKSYKSGARFLNTKLTAHSLDGKAFAQVMYGYPEACNIPILFGAPTPEEAKGGPTSARVNTCIAYDQSGELGQAIDILDTEFREQTVAYAAKIWKRMGPMKVASPIKRQYGDDTTKKDSSGTSMRGQMRDSPIISLSVDFTSFPQKFQKALAGKPRTVVYDWASRTVDDHGHELFNERLGDDGKPLCLTNAASIIKSGDIIRRILIASDGVSVTTTGVSFRIRLYKVWLESGTSTDINFLSSPMANLTFAPSTAAPAASSAAAPAASQLEPDDIPAQPIGTPAHVTIAPVASKAPANNEEDERKLA